MYGPNIESADLIEEIEGQNYKTRLFGNVKSPGMIEYLYVMAVYRVEENTPCTFITCEKNAMASALGGGSHFLCAFANESHLNFGSSDEWTDLNKFRDRAQCMAVQYIEKGDFDV